MFKTALDSVVRATGTIWTLYLGEVEGSDFSAGLADLDMAERVVDEAVDFADADAMIRYLNIRGIRGSWDDRAMLDSNFCAPNFGGARLRNAGAGDLYGLYVMNDEGNIRWVRHRETDDPDPGDNWVWRPGDAWPNYESLRMWVVN